MYHFQLMVMALCFTFFGFGIKIMYYCRPFWMHRLVLQMKNFAPGLLFIRTIRKQASYALEDFLAVGPEVQKDAKAGELNAVHCKMGGSGRERLRKNAG